MNGIIGIIPLEISRRLYSGSISVSMDCLGVFGIYENSSVQLLPSVLLIPQTQKIEKKSFSSVISGGEECRFTVSKKGKKEAETFFQEKKKEEAFKVFESSKNFFRSSCREVTIRKIEGKIFRISISGRMYMEGEITFQQYTWLRQVCAFRHEGTEYDKLTGIHGREKAREMVAPLVETFKKENGIPGEILAPEQFETLQKILKNCGKI